MKKQLIRLSLMVMPVLAVLSSCSKKDDDNNEKAALGQTTITGKVTADLILNNGQLENAPAGTVILASISTKDLVLNEASGATYAVRTYTTTVDANGNYSLTIDAGAKPVNVTVTPNPFSYDQVLENGATRSTSYSYTGSTITLSGIAGKSQVKNISYTANDVPGAKLGKVTITCDSVVYFNDMCASDPSQQYTFVPNGTIVVATWADDNGVTQERELTVTNGKIELEIETTRSGAIGITFKGRKFYDNYSEEVAGNCETDNNHAYIGSAIGDTGIKGELTRMTSRIEFH